MAPLPRPGIVFTPAWGGAPSRATVVEPAYTPPFGVTLAVEKWDGRNWVARPDIDQRWATAGKVTTAWEPGVPVPTDGVLLRYRGCLAASKERVCSAPGEAGSLSRPAPPRPIKLN